MTRFWNRPDKDSIERLLEAARPSVREELANRVIPQIPSADPRLAQRASFRRFAVAAVATALTIAIAGVLGGVHSAFAGVGNLVHVATQAAAPAKPASSNQAASKSDAGKKADQGKNDSGNEGKKGAGEDARSGDPDHQQYKVTICHFANHKYVTLTVSPQGAAQHKANHPQDIVPAPPGGCPR